LKSQPTVIIGAGPTGLSAAYHLGEDALLIEQHERVGGWCRSIVDNGFTFDFAGHIMFSNDPYVHEMYRLLLGENVHWQDREAWVYSKGVFTRYPFQGALYGLPPEVIKECIMGAVEARFGPVSEQADASGQGRVLAVRAQRAAPQQANGHAERAQPAAPQQANGHAERAQPAAPQQASGGRAVALTGPSADSKDAAGGEVEDCCADGTADAFGKDAPVERLSGAGCAPTASLEPRNFEEFIYRVWGAGIAKHFAVPYNRKIWAVPLDEMETSWLGGRVPLPNLDEMLEGALSPKPKPMGPNARFGYPLRGGFQALMDGFLPHLEGELRLSTTVTAVSPSRHELTLDDGTTVGYRTLVSTMPLPVLVRLMGDEAPPEVREAAAGLRHTSVRCVNLGIGRENITEKHWIYYPEETIFHRIFVQGNASPHCNPPGGFGITCEITYGPLKPLPCEGEELIKRCIEDCISVGIINADDAIWAANEVDMPYAYVIYDHARKGHVETIRSWMLTQDIVLSGRYSEWEYYNSDHAFVAGKQAAEAVRELQGEPLQEREIGA
jgi:UDP-galactopyranose mutase